MNINPTTNNQNFDGRLIVKNKISTTQNHLFNLHRPALEQKIKDMPFDLYVEQSKSKKTITLSTNIKDAATCSVKKNKQDFEAAADIVISDAKYKSDTYKKMVKVNQMFNYQKLVMANIVFGNFKEARSSEKQLAKLAVNDFETYKTIPHLKITNIPFKTSMYILKESIKYRVYKTFSPKTQEEKEFLKMKKEYYKKLKAEKKKPKTIEINFSQFY